MKSIACFFSHPIQYFAPMLKAVAAKDPLTVYFYSDATMRGATDVDFGVPVKWDVELLAGYTSGFLKNFSRRTKLTNHFGDAVNPGVFGSIRRQKDAVVWINGWSYASDLMAMLAAFIYRRPVWLRADNPLSLELKKSRKVLWIKKIMLRYFLFPVFIDRCLYVGKESRLFFEFYGMSPERLTFTPHAVDNDSFRRAAQKYSADISGLKSGLGLPAEKKIILFAGKFVPVKRPMDLLKAFRRLDREDYVLVMVGEGQLRPEIENYIHTEKMKQVYLPGFVNQSQISAWYAAADVFVLCSESETWGLVVNEVMNFAKPVVLSDTCGCAADLLEPGTNGFVYPKGDVVALADRIAAVLDDGSFRISAGKRSEEIVRGYSVEKIAVNVHEALTKTECRN